MLKSAFLLVCAMCVLPLHAATHHSSEFGWKAGQDVTKEFAALFADKKLGAGDELVLDHTYRIGGKHELPDSFTLSAVKGAGFDVTDAKHGGGKPFLTLGNKNTLRNLTITYLNTPPLVPGTIKSSKKKGESYYIFTGILASGKKDIRIENCRLAGNIGQHLKFVDCSRPQVIGCHILGGYWAVYLAGDVTDAVFRNTVFEKSQGDGIKTGMGGDGCQRALVENCVFQDNGRDGIDTTGGFRDSVVRNCIFRRLFSGMDLKSGYDSDDAVLSGRRNTGILVENCRFTDMSNCITLSTLDGGIRKIGRALLNAENCHEYAPHDIDINNCIFERTGESPVRMLFLKGGHTVRYRNARYLGEGIKTVGYLKVSDVFKSSLSEEVSEALNYGVTGTLGDPGKPGKPGDTSVPFVYGPKD